MSNCVVFSNENNPNQYKLFIMLCSTFYLHKLLPSFDELTDVCVRICKDEIKCFLLLMEINYIVDFVYW
jgi:hypothetical protein